MPDSVPRLAPEVGADIRSAQDRLLRAQREMEVTGDASAHLPADEWRVADVATHRAGG